MTQLQLIIEKLLNNGHGLARDSEGRVIFVPSALPGETVSVTDLKKSKGVWWARTHQRTNSSPDRVVPSCPHAVTCGGCQLQHIDPRREWRHKLAYLCDTLARTAGLHSIDYQVVDFPMDASRIRGKLHARQDGRIGFKASGSSQIVAVPSCQVVPRPLIRGFTSLTDVVASSNFSGEIYFAGHPDGHRLILEAIGRVDHPTHWQRLVGGSSANFSGVVVRTPKGRMLASAGTTRQSFRWDNCQVLLSPSQFFQSNPLSWSLFLQRVRQFQATHHLRNLWDVHAGSGFLSSALAPAEVLASEPEPRAFRQLTQLATQARATIRPLHLTAEATLAKETLDGLDGAMLDPPREGLSKPLRAWLKRSGPRALLYFSCDLASFCRDLRDLAPNYQPASPILVMNLSPGTVKLELALSLIRTSRAEPSHVPTAKDFASFTPPRP